MFCKKCGNELPDGAVFCGSCGEPVAAPATEENTSPIESTDSLESSVNWSASADSTSSLESEPAEKAPQSEDCAYASPSFSEPAFNEDEKRKKPRGKLLKGLLIAAIPVVLALIAFFNLDSITGFFIKTFGSDSDYFLYVESKSFESLSSDFAGMYDAVLLKNLNLEQQSTAEVKLTVGEDFSEMIDSYSDIDLDWLDNLSLSIYANNKDNVQEMNLGVNMSGERILSYDAILDANNQEIMMALPELSDDYIKLDTSEVYSGGTTMNDTLSIMSELKETVLPDEKTFNMLLTKYIKIALENIDDVTSESIVVEIDGISQKCTELKFVIDHKLALDISADVLAELKNDKEVEEIINNFQTAAEENDLIYDVDLYDEFIDAVDDALDSIEDTEPSDDGEIIIYDYVNGNHEVIGRKIVADDDEILEYATVRSGKDFAFELTTAENVLDVSGSGTESGDKISGTYDISVEGEDVFTLELVDFDTKTAKEGYLNGTIRLTPSSALWDMVSSSDYDAAAGFKLLDPSLELIYDCSKDSFNASINILTNGEVFVGLSSTCETGKSDNVDIPSGDFVDGEDEDEMSDWAKSLDMDSVIDKLEDAELPSDIINAVEEFADMIEEGSSYGSSYDYDTSYDDYSSYSSYYGY